MYKRKLNIEILFKKKKYSNKTVNLFSQDGIQMAFLNVPRIFTALFTLFRFRKQFIYCMCTFN